jgi:hypothetical protein
MQNKKSIPKIKKDIGIFLSSEEGKIVEKDVIGLGIAMIAVAGILGGVMITKDANAQCVHTSHGSHASHASHSSHGSHGSHASHASHSSHASHASHASY